jgi:two-component system, OmpR family, osmolarity sensor histidine kinase EnvZ
MAALMSSRGIMRRYFPRGLFSRSLIIIVTPVVLLQALVTYLMMERQWQTVSTRMARGVAANVAMLVTAHEKFQGAQQAELVARLAEAGGFSTAVRPGDMLPQTESPAEDLLRQVFVRELGTNIKRPVWIDSETLDGLVDIRVQLDASVMRVLIDRKRTVSTNTHINVVWMAGTALLLLAVAILFLRNQVRPIERLADAAEAFGKGRDVPDFRPSGATEVRRAAFAFLDMRERISRAIQQRTEMLAGVSHDLRTPITRMKLQLAMMPENQDVKELTGDVIEMERMVEEYLAFARGQAGETPVEIDVSKLLNDLAVNARRTLEAEGAEANGATKKLELTAPQGLALEARPNAIRRCVTNLVDNALRHGARVQLSARETGGMIEITVDDDGPGIPEHRREEAFRPFHRLDEGRNLETGGSGLGLAIARDIARGHGGDLILNSSPLGGLRALVRLPV